MREEPSYYVKKYNSHQRKQCAAGQNDKENCEKVLCRALYQAEFSMDAVCAELFRSVRMTVQSGTDFTTIVFMCRRFRIVTA